MCCPPRAPTPTAAISAAIGALKGPKHGGANLKVMHQLDYILANVEHPEDDGEVREMLRKILRKERVTAAA